MSAGLRAREQTWLLSLSQAELSACKISSEHFPSNLRKIEDNFQNFLKESYSKN